MADNVFGEPITEGTRKERARMALSNLNIGNKRDQALHYVRRKKEEWGGDGASTLGIFYNATGDNINFTQENSSYGEIRCSYPNMVENGQWGAFLHVNSSNVPQSGSKGFVVYRVRNNTEFTNVLISWWTQEQYMNQAYCAIFEDGRVDPQDEIYFRMNQQQARQAATRGRGMNIHTFIETGTSPVYQTLFTREDEEIERATLCNFCCTDS